MTEPRYSAQALIEVAGQLLQRGGLPSDRARIVAETLVEGDLMGHSTHGLQLLAQYLVELEKGGMAKTGEPEVVSDRGAALTWDGHYLPGPWLVRRAMDEAFERIQTHPVVTVVIRRSHHIACLAAYPKRATDRGLFMLLHSSDPATKSVAPFGGVQPMYTPNPVAAGIPTRGDPIILDISMSTTTNGLVGRLNREGKRLPHPWILDAQGRASDNPADAFTNPPGTILPLGGLELGYKGFALGLLVEAMTSALGGYGRADEPTQWGASVFLQMIDPQAFGGLDAFTRETTWFAENSQNSPVPPGRPPVRLPGSRALNLRAQQLEHGVVLYEGIIPALKAWSDKFGVPLPVPMGDK
jgi:LDH2 family malate/lactate/ureidoglycolate dehydrogenase